MYAFIEGTITRLSSEKMVVNVGGVGYELHVSALTAKHFENAQRARVWTHLYVKEDVLALFGFAQEEEKTYFIQLISVSGIGPNTARTILSDLTPQQIRQCILQENVQAFSSVKGIGPKTAKRIILDLKDKMLKLGDLPADNTPAVNNTLMDEALSGLVALGFNKNRVQKLLIKVVGERPDINSAEQLIKEVLKQLS